MTHYLAIDVGTHSVRAAIVDEQATILQQQQHALELSFPRARHVEQNPLLLLQACYTCVAALKDFLPNCTCVALVIQRSTVLAWHRQTGRPLSAALSWQDTRGFAQIAALNRAQRQTIQSRTGLQASAYYGASKIACLQARLNGDSDEINGAHKNASLCIGPLASWLSGQLISSPNQACFTSLCDESNAARTLLFNTQTRRWDDELCRLFNINKALLPTLCSVVHPYGDLYIPDLPDLAIPLVVLCGDQNAAFACAQAIRIRRRSDFYFNRNILVNMGTGAFVLAPSPEQKPTQQDHASGMLHTLAYSCTKQLHYALEGTVNGAACAISDFIDRGKAALLAVHGFPVDEHAFFKLLANIDQQQHIKCVYLNTVNGLGAPWWDLHLNTEHACFLSTDSQVRQVGKGSPNFCDLQRMLSLLSAGQASTEASAQQLRAIEQLCAAVAESIVFLLMAVLERCMQPRDMLVASGGLARSSFIVQRLATLSQKVLYMPESHELSIIGAVVLASRSDIISCRRDHRDMPNSAAFLQNGRCVLPNMACRKGILQRYQLFMQTMPQLIQQAREGRDIEV